jgi:hypothetical protein
MRSSSPPLSSAARARTCVRRVSFVTVGLLAMGITLAACGGPSTPSVATGSSTTTSRDSSGGTTPAASLLAYARCMRSHGVPNFPDPVSGEGIPKSEVVSAFEAVGKPKAVAASNDCKSLLPSGGLGGQSNPIITAPEQQDYLKAAACMRTHGYPNFPDPIFPSGGGVDVPIPSSINTRSAHFNSVARLCTKVIPAGLPDSNPSG